MTERMNGSLIKRSWMILSTRKTSDDFPLWSFQWSEPFVLANLFLSPGLSAILKLVWVTTSHIYWMKFWLLSIIYISLLFFKYRLITGLTNTKGREQHFPNFSSGEVVLGVDTQGSWAWFNVYCWRTYWWKGYIIIKYNYVLFSKLLIYV